MKEYKLTDIFIYPVKSLGGFSVKSSKVTDRGLKFDRRWMLIDEENKFLSQRKIKDMALLQTSLGDKELFVFRKDKPEEKIKIPFGDKLDKKEKSIVWDDVVELNVYPNEINEWFSEQLEKKCRLVFMPETTERKVDTRYALNNEITSLSDGYPFLMIGEESLKLLNSKLSTPLSMNRFRPNLVFSGGEPHDEDGFGNFKINDTAFQAVKPCGRCVITTIDQQTGEQGTEPLQTLATYRTAGNKVNFGMNLIHEGNGTIKIGDYITLH